MSEILLQLKGISKTFGNNKVLNNVKLDLRKGEVLALLGENGAGKSTLMKILAGIYSKDSGEIHFDGKLVRIVNADDAKKLGISIIHQELMLGQNMTVAENLFMGRELVKKLGFVNIKKQNIIAQKMLDKFNLGIKGAQVLKGLTIAEQQMVEIIRAISFGAKLVVMDEPTSSLSNQEIKILYDMINKLKGDGVGIIYISHKLNELYDIADNVTVLRDGEYVNTVAIKDTTKDQLVKMMVGREINNYYYKTNVPSKEVIMSVRNVSDGIRVKDVSFDLHKGEILGIAGLVGAGRSEAMQSIVGIRKMLSGTVLIENKQVKFKTPNQAIENGIGYVPEDRKLEGLFLLQDIEYNTTINVLDKIIKGLKVNRQLERQLVDEKMKQFAVKAVNTQQIMQELSGGNQQKILIARWLLSTKRILILDEPTRGIDVKSKAEIYQLINGFANNGISIILVSSELTELINMSDRICVFSSGKTTGTLSKEDFVQEKIMTLATS